MHVVFELMRRLRSKNMTFTLASYRNDVITILFAIPDKRYEIDVSEDGSVDIAEFIGDEVGPLNLSDVYKQLD